MTRLRACGAVSDRDRALAGRCGRAAPAEDASRPPRVAASAARDALQACLANGVLRGVKIARRIPVVPTKYDSTVRSDSVPRSSRLTQPVKTTYLAVRRNMTHAKHPLGTETSTGGCKDSDIEVMTTITVQQMLRLVRN